MGPEEERATFTIVILPKQNAKSNLLKDKYIAFATNLPEHKVLWNISIIPEEYRKRWGIETGYKGVEQFRARTTSRNRSLRTFYFYYALIVYNAWLLANIELTRKFATKFRVNISMQFLKGVFHTLYIEHLRQVRDGG